MKRSLVTCEVELRQLSYISRCISDYPTTNSEVFFPNSFQMIPNEQFYTSQNIFENIQRGKVWELK